MSSLKEKAFYIWSYERKREPRRECKGKTCPLYRDNKSWIDCQYYVAGWCNNSDYGIPADEPLVTLKDAQEEIDGLKQKLQQFKNLLSKENEPKLHMAWSYKRATTGYGSANFTNIELFRMHMEKLRKKFEELLKEEKEAK